MITNLEERLEGTLETVPDYYHNSRVYLNILTAYLAEHQRNDDNRRDLLNQFFVQTATWGLDYWEYDYAIGLLAAGDTLEIRRARLLAKMAGLGTFTKAEALRLANVYSDPKTAEFFSIVNEGAFKTRHNIDDLIDYDSMVAAFEEMKPAHLEHIIGLLIKLPIGPKMATASSWKVGKSEVYGPAYTQGVKMRLNAAFVVPGKYSADPPDMLVLDGSYTMNGYSLMDSKAPGGKLHYIRNSEKLTIRTFKDGNLIETVTV